MVRHWAALLTVAALLGLLLGLYRQFSVSPPRFGTAIDTAPPVSAQLLRDDGQMVTVGGPSAQVRLILFGFRRCEESCALTLGVLTRAAQGLSERERRRLEVGWVSIDQTDSPASLRRYLARFDMPVRAYSGPQAGALARQLYILPLAEGKNLVHGDEVAVLDRQGHYRRVYGGASVMAGELTQDLPRLLRAY